MRRARRGPRDAMTSTKLSKKIWLTKKSSGKDAFYVVFCDRVNLCEKASEKAGNFHVLSQKKSEKPSLEPFVGAKSRGSW